ncbi:MAG TPA: arabinose operon transcriptional regulator AraC [Planctomycetota bacterium]|nr:arabinose operon transcriptional regulator AraC [Planctomycetota bacterium]
MPTRLSFPETPYTPVTQVVCGHIVGGPRYHGYRPRGTREWLLIYTVKGRGRFGHAGGDLLAQPGDMVLIKPQTPQDYGIEAELQHWELLWAHFNPRPEWLQWLEWPEDAPGLLRISVYDASVRRSIVQCFRETLSMAASPMRLRESFAMNALERVLLMCDAVNPRSRESSLDARVRKAMNYVCSNLSSRIDRAALARESSLSVSRLSHLFRAEVGMSLRQFVERQRLERAAQLLQMTSLSIKEIAFSLGFDNPFYFTLRFKQHFGSSPRAYRKKALAQQSTARAP